MASAEEPVRVVILASIIVFSACGSSPPPVGKVGPSQATLHIVASGDGMVRGAGADCRGSCTATPAAGASVHLEAVPDSGATFAGWSGACSGAAPCDVTVQGEMSVTATFSRPVMRKLTVAVQGEGRVVSTPAGIDCAAGACSATFTDGASVALVATSATGSAFGGWSGACSGTAPCNVTLQNDMQISAKFDLLPVRLTATVTGPGQVTGAGLTCGNGASTCGGTIMPGTAVTFTAAAAPQARFMGWTGACTGNAATCKVTVRADTAVAASFEFELQTLVPNDGRTFPSFALNSTSVFFGRYGADGVGVWAIPKKGGTPSLVSPGIPYQIVADDAFVYWSDGSGIYSAPVGGGSASLIASGASIGRLVLDDDGALYWVAVRDWFQGGRKGAVHRIENRVDSVIAVGQNQNFGLAVDATHAYFTCSAPDGTDRSIRRVPKKGGSVELVVTTTNDPLALRLDAQNVYYRDSTGTVAALRKSGGSPRVLSAANGTFSSVGSADVDVNASVVWWVWADWQPSSMKGLFRANADGTAWTAVDTSTDSNWIGPRVDDTAVYYIHAGALVKHLK